MKFNELPNLTKKDINRFFEYVQTAPKPNCWEWQGHTDGKYGTLSVKNKAYKAHRISYFIHNGVKPSPEKDVCHKCDNPICVNPAHLFEGTRQENLLDCIAKGRKVTWNPPKGDESPYIKLSEKDISDIQITYGTGLFSTREIAERYEVARSLIHRIVAGKSRTDSKTEPNRKRRQNKENRMRFYLETKRNAFLHAVTPEDVKNGRAPASAVWLVSDECYTHWFWAFTEIQKHYEFTAIDVWSAAIEYADSLTT
jgi:HNH endonuclease